MDYWQKQTLETPLFPDLLWSRPVTKQGAGKLLIIGGNQHGFVHVAGAYGAAEAAGAGNVRVIVPDSLAKITKHVPNIEYAPSTPSGSFAKNALAQVLEAAAWSDGVLLAGDMGKNSETSLLLEGFLAKYRGILAIDYEAAGSITLATNELLAAGNRVLVWQLDNLRHAVIDLQLPYAVTSNIGKPALAEILHELSKQHAASIIVKTTDSEVWIAKGGKVASSETKEVVASASFAVWALQNPAKLYEALVSAACA